jgi:hypothetical protein
MRKKVLNRVRAAAHLTMVLGAASLVIVVLYVVGKYLVLGYEASELDRRMSGISLVVPGSMYGGTDKGYTDYPKCLTESFRA